MHFSCEVALVSMASSVIESMFMIIQNEVQNYEKYEVCMCSECNFVRLFQ